MMYYQIDNKIYYLNLNNVFSIITQTPSEEKMVNTTITQYYGDGRDGSNNGKEIVESKSNLNETMNQIRYDLVRIFINGLLSDNYGSVGEPMGIRHLNEMSFSQGLCFNTLIENKILLEVEKND